MKRENKKDIGILLLGVALLVSAYLLGLQAGRDDRTAASGPVSEDCEYKEGDFYFKGSCSDVHTFNRVKWDEADIEKQYQDIEEEWHNLEREYDQKIVAFSERCHETTTQNLYRNAHLLDETFDLPFEEFKANEDTKLIIGAVCDE